MASRDAFISNGTCYYAPGQEAIDSMIPCGNDAFGRVSCCQQGDMCLTSNACYNQQFGVTYLAGCSDPTYEHRSCPDKGAFDGTPWVGLTYCNGTSEQWVACEQSERQDALTEADQCWCPQTDRTVAFTASSVLVNVAELPTSVGGEVVWQRGFLPSFADTDTATSTTPPTQTTSTSPSTSSQVGSTNVPAETSPAATETPESTDNGLSTPARIGIGVGVGVGSAVLLALLALFFFTRRRRQRHEAQANASPKGDRPDSLMPPSEAPQTPTTAVSEIDSRAATPWALRTELDGKSLAAEMVVPPVPPVPSQLGEKKEKRKNKSDEPVFELPA
ncbi:hypothetical protein BN1723_013792, partial [Verticillium longisporum]